MTRQSKARNRLWLPITAAIVLGILIAGCGNPPQESSLPSVPEDLTESVQTSIPASSSPAPEQAYRLGNILDAFGWCGMQAENLGVHHSYIGDNGIEIEGDLFGGHASGTALFAVSGDEEKVVSEIRIHVRESDLAAEDCLSGLRDLYGRSADPEADSASPEAADTDGQETFQADNGTLTFSRDSGDEYMLVFQWDPNAQPESMYATGDFDVSDPKWNRILWDADGDGTEEELVFEYQDNGDEAPSYIEVTLYIGGEELSAVIDRAYGLNRIFSKEDEHGPYLEIYYAIGDYYSHDAEASCLIRLQDGAIVVQQE